MKILILGGTGHIGKVAIKYLKENGLNPIAASRGYKSADLQSQIINCDTCSLESLKSALSEVDVVVNCVAGDAKSIALGAKTLVDAAISCNKPKIVHLSTMSVYGNYEGIATEKTPFDPTLGWYAASKCEAEQEMARYANSGGRVVVLRPGCVYGPGSELWVGRIGRWLKAGRIGDLGAAGDGWSNLVHVDDVCTAIYNAITLDLAPTEIKRYNLSAPDSPRWNDYIVDLGRSIKADPIQRVRHKQLVFDTKIVSPMLKIFEIILKKIGSSGNGLPTPFPPALLRFFGQQIKLESETTPQILREYTSYASGLKSSTEWFLNKSKP